MNGELTWAAIPDWLIDFEFFEDSRIYELLLYLEKSFFRFSLLLVDFFV